MVEIGVGMKRQKRYLCIAAVLLSLFLSGCGTQLYELTQEEEELVVHAAAYYVAKHNVQQKDGVSAEVDPDSIIVEPESTETLENIIEENTELAEEVISSSEAGVQNEQNTGNSVTLAEIIGHKKDLSVTYSGCYIAENYIEGSAYSVDADKGKVFYVMEFIIANDTEKNVEVDNASINLIFKLVSDGVSAKSEVTFLTTDFSTYQGTISAGETVKTILLFEVSEGVAEQIVSPTLQITIDNVTKNVKL